jgi:hypothetical protein
MEYLVAKAAREKYSHNAGVHAYAARPVVPFAHFLMAWY